MKMSKNYKKLCLVLGLSGIIGTGAVAAQSGTQNVQATYRNIQVTYNGANQSMAVEPFLVNGSVYVPLRAVGDIFGVTPTWVPTTNTVQLTGGSTTDSSAEIQNLQYQVATLTQQLNAANTELATYKANSTPNSSTGSNVSSTSADKVKETENWLNNNLANELSKNITMYYTVTATSTQINVNISYETRSENTAYENLSQSKIETFMKKVGDNIAATHNDVAINGTIEYTKDSEEKATFTRSKAGRYTYSHAFDNNSLKEAIEDETGNYFYFNNMSPNSLSINGYDVNIREAKSTVNVKVYLGTDANFRTTWGTPSTITSPTTNAMTSAQRKNAVADQLATIQDTITDIASDYDVNIYVYYGSNDLIAQLDSNGSITTDAIDQ